MVRTDNEFFNQVLRDIHGSDGRDLLVLGEQMISNPVLINRNDTEYGAKYQETLIAHLEALERQVEAYKTAIALRHLMTSLDAKEVEEI